MCQGAVTGVQNILAFQHERIQWLPFKVIKNTYNIPKAVMKSRKIKDAQFYHHYMKGGWVVRIFHLFCPRFYVGFQLNNTKGESNKYMPTHLWALQGSGVCHSH